LLRRIKLEDFYIRSSLFAFLSLVGAILNYALYPSLAHVLNPTEFGDFVAVLAISNQLLGIMLAFTLTSISLVNTYPEDEAREKAQIIQKVLIWLFLGATAVLLVVSPLIRQQLHIVDPLTFVILALLLVAAVPAVMWTGYLQGHQRVIKVGIYNVAGVVSKLVLALLFARLWGVSGGLLGVLAGTMLGILTLRLIAGMRLPSLRSSLTPLTASQWTYVRGTMTSLGVSVLVVGMLSVLQNIDIIFAKILFPPAVAGVYSGISVLSNALYFLGLLLVWIVLPAVSPANPRHNRRLLRTSYSLLALMAVGVMAGEYLLRNVLARSLLGLAFGGQGDILILASLFQILLVGSTLYAYYLLVLRRKRSLLLAGCVFLPSVAAPAVLVPGDTRAMITTLLLATLLGWVAYGIGSGIYHVVLHARGRTQ
jgi:O-antigen/teichoic acid export membrane protein